MPDDKHTGRAVWLASYPKSGNTWLRLLLEAYRCNGALDINDVRVCISDGAATVTQGVSPMPLDRLNLPEGWLSPKHRVLFLPLR